MPAPTKSLRELVRDRSFLARRHAARLVEEETVAEPALAELQLAYVAETDGLERQKLAREFERVVRTPAEEGEGPAEFVLEQQEPTLLEHDPSRQGGEWQRRIGRAYEGLRRGAPSAERFRHEDPTDLDMVELYAAPDEAFDALDAELDGVTAQAAAKARLARIAWR